MVSKRRVINTLCKLKKPIYSLKQAFRQSYLKFDKVVTSLGFKENDVDWCIYLRLIMGWFMILILHIDDVLLVSTDKHMLNEMKQLLSHHFKMKDLTNAILF